MGRGQGERSASEARFERCRTKEDRYGAKEEVGGAEGEQGYYAGGPEKSKRGLLGAKPHPLTPRSFTHRAVNHRLKLVSGFSDRSAAYFCLRTAGIVMVTGRTQEAANESSGQKSQ
jgi:hypothetical protein